MLTKIDPVRLEVFHHLFAAVCDEAGALLQRGAASVNVRERRDFSCALFDSEGRLVAQAAHIPVHLGSAADAVAAARESLELTDGDIAILNDPYRGGTHLPDVTMVRAITLRRGITWYALARAHHADIGGSVPGSMGIAVDLIGEGLVIPPVYWQRKSEPCRDVRKLVFANVRGSDERAIDLSAQEAALDRIAVKVRGLAEEHGVPTLQQAACALMDYSESVAKSVVEGIPRRADLRAFDLLEDDGFGEGPFELGLRVCRRPGGRLLFDWSAPPAARGGINANRGIVTAAAVYVLRCLCPGRLPTNDGVFRALEVRTPAHSLLDPDPPAPVAGGNVETSQRLVDLGFAALASAMPDRVPAGSAGTMSNVTIGNDNFAIYETLPGGAGAGPHGPGVSGVQTHMTNTRNTPIEETERRSPVRVRSLTLQRKSGGLGAQRGGDGVVKEVEALEPMTASIFAERRVRGGKGAQGGSDGRPGAARVLPRDGKPKTLPSKCTCPLEPGDVLRITTPGGGGYGG